MENSKIEWTKHTGNIWEGCTEVHEGCDNCYARVLNHRWGKANWGNDVPRQMSKSFFSNMDKYQKMAKAANEIHRVFVGSMMDIFEKPMPVIDSKGEIVPCVGKQKGINTGDLREMFFQNITNGWYPNLMFLLLTKRPSNINKYIPESWKENPPANVMFGTSPVSQKTYETLIPQLLQVKGKKFLSMEPMLEGILIPPGHLDNARYFDLIGGTIDWVIVGGESGPKKRPFNSDWARSIRDQCVAYKVPFFMKQIDKIQPIPADLMIRQFPN